jgi:hypothetical protein
MSFKDGVGEGLAPTGILNQNHMWSKKITVHIHFFNEAKVLLDSKDTIVVLHCCFSSVIEKYSGAI